MLAFALAATAWSATAPPASAGTYDVWSCRGSDGAALGTEAWQRSVPEQTGGLVGAPTAVAFNDDCAINGSLTATLTSGALISGPVTARLAFEAPPDTSIERYTLIRALRAGQGVPFVTAYAVRHTELTRSETETFSQQCAPLCGGLPDEPESIITRDPAQGDVIRIEAGATCLFTCLNLELTETMPRAELYSSQITLEDVHAPSEPVLSGSLVDDPASGSGAAIEAASTDRGGGIESMTLTIDGQPRQTVRAGSLAATCRKPYTETVPCPTDAAQRFEIDTGALEPGDHSAAVTVVDAAGNSTTSRTVAFRVDRPTEPPPGPDNGVPAVERPVLRLARRVVQIGAGATALLRGTLATRDGRAIRGARLDVSTRALGLRGTVPSPTRRWTIRTDAAGRFSIRQRARGARRVTVAFSPRRDAAATAVAAATVRARLALSAAPRSGRLVKGRRLVLRGKLRGAGPSAYGALVQVQAIVNGRWAPVGRARVRRDGSFAWRYRFVHLSRDTVFRFRAVVERAPGWPWPTIRSKRVGVRVDVP